jgi:site-specific DNA recombinase
LTVRCAIYTRKSTDEGLEQSFNSLDAQREACEAYITSQKSEGWQALATRYDDGGYSGGNVDRPAFQQLMEDVRQHRVDAVVVYKIDRLSRSLMDFAKIMATLDELDVSLVSVTQQFNTTSSMGRLTLNILLSFAQFEREIISERTRDKIGAMRRRGKLWGGKPILGYDVERDARGSRLIVNADEADKVRHIFDMYRDHQAMMPVVAEIQRLGWINKRWTTKAGAAKGGGTIDKAILWRILTNVTYIGKVAYEGEVYDGEHAAIIDSGLWQTVQAMLVRNGRSGGHADESSRTDDALLRGRLICKHCGCTMVPTYTVKDTANGRTRYRYYVCLRATKKGRSTCPHPRLPAEEIEQFVVNEIAAIGRDATVRERVVAEAEQQLASQAKGKAAKLDRDAVHAALGDWDLVWQTMSLPERRRMIELLIDRVVFDGAAGQVSITFHPTGIASLGDASEPTATDEPQEVAA